jgi:hypothetical protein
MIQIFFFCNMKTVQTVTAYPACPTKSLISGLKFVPLLLQQLQHKDQFLALEQRQLTNHNIFKGIIMKNWKEAAANTA